MSWTNPFATKGSVVDQYARNVALTADTNATSALSIVGTANTNATSALNMAGTANSIATGAGSMATQALQDASLAMSVANSAQQDATSALTSAGTANSLATQGLLDASLAMTLANTADTSATKALQSLPLCVYSQIILTPDILGTYEAICSLDITTMQDGFISVNATSVYTNLTNSHKNILYYLEIETEMGQEYQALLHNQTSSQLVVSANFTTAARVVAGTYHITLYVKCVEGDTNVLAEIATLNAIGHLY